MSSNKNLDKGFPLLKLIVKNLLLIVLISVLCALIGLGYSVLRVKPTYTASRSVILRTTLNQSGKAALANQATLGKMYLPSILEVIKSTDIITTANENYDNEEEKILVGSVGMEYEINSLIFDLTYTDKSPELAKEKLEVFIDTLSDEISKYIKAEDVKLIHTQRESDVFETQYYTNYTVIGLVGGIAISMVIVLLIYVFDNTVKSKNEYEEITGMTVVAFIDKDVEKSKK